jgi:predicted dehydrogenase
MKKTPIWLVGAGKIAQEYATVLNALQCNYTVVGRSARSCDIFEKNRGTKPIVGGVERALELREAPETAIVTVGIEQLPSVVNSLIFSGTRTILVEKPGGLTHAEVSSSYENSKNNNVNLFVAYNRRFLTSVIEAEKMIAEDGGIVSAHFEFTEWSHLIADLNHSDTVKQRWLIANSSHVIDLAFHFCGRPRNWNPYQVGGLKWHSSAARFMGAGVTNRNIAFSYFADWEGPGRWGLELITKKRRLIFKPLEKLTVIRRGSLIEESIQLSDDIEINFKPGLYRQTQALLDGQFEKLCSIEEQLENIKCYSMIAGYEL